jgi:hypothetical protein
VKSLVTRCQQTSSISWLPTALMVSSSLVRSLIRESRGNKMVGIIIAMIIAIVSAIAAYWFFKNA